MPEETENTSFMSKVSKLSKESEHLLVVATVGVAILVFVTICFCEAYMCVWHSHQADYNYALPNEMWLIATGISSFLFGGYLGMKASKPASPTQ
jgi:hypothetical protein